MKQVFLTGGKVEVSEVPAPGPAPRRALIATAYSVISAGTEKAALGSSARSPFRRAASHPSPLQRAVEVAREEGISGILRRLAGSTAREEPQETGYSASGVIVEKGSEISLAVGTRVACAGSQFAHHAELISVPENLLSAVPPEVSLEQAAFATLGAIALHGFRRSEARVGETVGVVGLGLVGLLGAQIARAAGCRVLAFDPDERRVELARSLGLEEARPLGGGDPAEETLRATGGQGADVVLVFAASAGNEPLTLALQLARKKGKVVVTGDVGMQVDRSLLYAKELDLLISTSYGPGRYDPTYEEEGRDYPYPYVRWTQGRNLAAFLRLLADRRVAVDPLIEKIWPLSQAEAAYLSLERTDRRPAVLLAYPMEQVEGSRPARTIPLPVSRAVAGEIGIAVVGPGRFMREAFLPILTRQRGIRIRSVVSSSGASARSAAERFSAAVASTDLQEILADSDLRLVVVGTRHHLHAAQAVAALRAGKAVFVEKPLCLSIEELERIDEARQKSGTLLAVGFNRRYAPLVREMKRRLGDLRGPKVISIRVNAGRLPADHWTQNPEVGGGRLVGEGCHFLDLIPFLAGSPIAALQLEKIPSAGEPIPVPDNFHLTLRMADGSLGSLLYTSLGDAGLPKERVEVHAAGHSLVLDDFRELTLHAAGKTRRISGRRDKGIEGEVLSLLAALRGEESDLISWEEIEAATRWTLRGQELLEKGS